MEKKVSYATVRCTYVELHDAAGNHVYTVCGKDCKRLNVIPFAVENFEPMEEKFNNAVRGILRYYNRYPGQLDKLQSLVGNQFHVYSEGNILDLETNFSWSCSGLLDMAKTRMFLTAGGFDLIKDLSGAKKAYDISEMDLYAYSPFISIAENVNVTPEPEPDPVQPKQNNSLIGKLLLVLAGWALFK